MPRPPSPSRLLLRWLDESPAPIYALDAQRRIFFANQSLGTWLSIPPTELVGLKCEYGIFGEGPRAALASALCPPPEAFTGSGERGWISRPSAHREESGSSSERDASGNITAQRRRARFIRLAGSKEESGLVLVVVSPTDESQSTSPEQPAESQQLHALLVELHSKLGKRFHTSQLLGQSAAMCRVREQVRIAAMAHTRVLIVGPQGSGREHVARTIHYAQSPPTIGSLIPIACPVVDAEQMQATLASLLRRQYAGPAEKHPVALLLDADQLQPDAQQELSGFLALPNVELHTLATSERNLLRLAKRGKFREDLALSLSPLTIELPALKDHSEDIPLLAQHFLEASNAGRDRPFSGFHPAALELLLSYAWPGNIDELARAVREACERASGPMLQAADLPDWVHLARNAAAYPRHEDETIVLDDFLAGIERELLERALAQARGNKSRAAQLLGINRARLLRRLSQLGLAPPPTTEEEIAAEEPVIFEPLDGS